MVFGLALDVGGAGSEIRFANGESAVAVLP
jgi:hypothetical protein